MSERLYVAWLAGCVFALLVGSVLLWPGCTIAGGACPCPRGQICRSGRCLPERTP